MAQHTPGPWVLHGTGTQVLGGKQCLTSICNVFVNSRGADPEEHRANASLIVAAPDLLDVARMLVEMMDAPAPRFDLGDCVMRARAAIAKAEGSSC